MQTFLKISFFWEISSLLFFFWESFSGKKNSFNVRMENPNDANTMLLCPAFCLQGSYCMITFEKCLLFGFDWASFFFRPDQDKKLLFLKFDAEGRSAPFEIKTGTKKVTPIKSFSIANGQWTLWPFPAFANFYSLSLATEELGPFGGLVFKIPQRSQSSGIFSVFLLYKSKNIRFLTKGSLSITSSFYSFFKSSL